MMSHTMYANDLMIVATRMEVAQNMLDGVRATFANAGLRVDPEKCKCTFSMKGGMKHTNCRRWMPS